MNFSDLEMDDSSENWIKTSNMMERILDEVEPDLVILTGDIVKPKYEYTEGYAAQFGNAMKPIKDRKIPYAWTGGNPISDIDDEQLKAIDNNFGGSLSWTGFVWDLDHPDMPHS